MLIIDWDIKVPPRLKHKYTNKPIISLKTADSLHQTTFACKNLSKTHAQRYSVSNATRGHEVLMFAVVTKIFRLNFKESTH